MVPVFHLPLLRVAGEADVVVRGEQQAGPSRLSHSRIASISPASASCSATRWSRPNTINVSVSASTRSSIGSL